MWPHLAPKLDDCRRHGPGSGAELFVVEGDSAAGSLRLVRDHERQAVLPMQGKPLNADKASPARVAAYPLFTALAEAVGAGQGPSFVLARRRYERVVLLMDADADGIHCAALMCLYFSRMMWPLLEAGHVFIAHAPLATVYAGPQATHVFTEVEYRAAADALRAQGADVQTVRYRGLAGLSLATLAASCMHPDTRTLRVLGPGDAVAVRTVFGGTAPQPTLF
ncbi:MAG: toprim domain-containing protein [Acidobacteriota bacterium]